MLASSGPQPASSSASDCDDQYPRMPRPGAGLGYGIRGRRFGRSGERRGPMAGTPTREELLGRIRAARAAWEEAVAAVRGRAGGAGGGGGRLVGQGRAGAPHRRPPLAGRPVARGAARRVADRRGVLRPRRDPAPGADLADTEQRNRWRQAIDRRRPLDEVLANAPRWADELEAAVAALPEADWPAPTPSPTTPTSATCAPPPRASAAGPSTPSSPPTPTSITPTTPPTSAPPGKPPIGREEARRCRRGWHRSSRSSTSRSIAWSRD